MTITVNQEVKKIQTQEIPVPSFWKDGISYLGFLNKDTVCLVQLSDDYAAVVNGTPEQMKSHTAFIDKYEPSSEFDFFLRYGEAREATSLEAEIVETGVHTSRILNNGHED